jgi:inositol transport system ATP-binding protein
VTNLLLRARGLSKSFPGVRALEDVSLEVGRGTAHVLMGEKGAGKSTLARLLAGLAEPDSGSVELKGASVRLRHPQEALWIGISMIHQELLLFPEMTAAENVLMGREPVRGWGGWLDRPRMNAEAARLLERLGAPIPPTRRVKELDVAERQTVEIAKALTHRADVLIMDEPTSSLSEREAEALFRVIADLKREGAAVLYVSHKMEEIFRIADTVTVLRDGRRVGTHPIGALTPDRLIALMVGRELDLSSWRAPAEPGETALEAIGPAQLSGLTLPDGIVDCLRVAYETRERLNSDAGTLLFRVWIDKAKGDVRVRRAAENIATRPAMGGTGSLYSMYCNARALRLYDCPAGPC